MTGYTPKRGDKVNVIVPATVAEVTPGGVRLDASELGPGWWVGSADEVIRLELVEAASVPFVVGGPITAEMGEPPEWSVVGHVTGPFWNWTKRDLWHGPDGETRSWYDLYDGPRTTLLRLGDGSQS